ncbi:hypothetical protein JCM6882_005230 [Rhodosporidiobolus microsporus]
MSSLHHGHSAPSASHHHPPLHSHGGTPSGEQDQAPVYVDSPSSGYDGSSLGPATTASSTAPLTGRAGGGCLAEEDDEAGRGRDDVTGGGGDGAQGDEGMLHPPEEVERPGMRSRSSSDRLRSVARALEAANILSLSSSSDWDTRPPGIDPRRVDIPDLKCRCVIQAADWSADRIEFSVLTNKDGPGELEEFLDKGRPEFAKVRWIHVNGLDWSVLKALALKHDLHPLSLEDMLHHGSSSSTRSKVDYFRQHLFVSLIVHRTLEQPAVDVDVPEEVLGPGMARTTTKALKSKGAGRPERHGHLRETFGFHHHRRDEEAIVESTTSLPLPLQPSATSSSAAGSYLATPIPTGGTASPAPGLLPGQGAAIHPKSYAQYRRDLREAFRGVKREKEESVRTLTHNRAGLSTRLRARATGYGKKKGAAKRLRKDEDERAAARWTVSELTKDVKVHIHVEQLGIFLLRDGTIISFTQDPGYHHQVSTLFDRLHSRDDLLRDSEDASFVLQGLLDVTADAALDIVDEMREVLTGLESKVLSRADMEDVRHLHILSSQLLLLKSTLTPLQLLLQSLRAQDDAKAAAAFRLDPSTRPSSPAVGVEGVSRGGAGGAATPHRKGFVSPEARVYLGDVMDHVDSVLSSLELFGDLSENLIAYTFNNLSYSSNAYMQALSVISLVFLPATFLSSYFGMNFTTGHFIDELDVGVSRFWSIVIPTSVITVVLFGWEYLAMIFRAMYRNFRRVWHKIQVTRSRKDQ